MTRRYRKTMRGDDLVTIFNNLNEEDIIIHQILIWGKRGGLSKQLDPIAQHEEMIKYNFRTRSLNRLL